MISKSRLGLKCEVNGTVRSRPSPRRNGGKETRVEANGEKCVHGIRIREQLEELFLWPLGLPRGFVARKWGRFFGMNIIMAEALDGILAISPL